MMASALHRRLLGPTAGLLLAIASLCSLAQSDAPADPGDDPPARAGRLAYAEGPVSLRPAGVPDWNAAPLNQPLTSGDSVWSDAGARAELDLGEARVRLTEQTSVGIVELSDRAVQLRLDAGSIEVSVSELADLDAFEIDAPNAAVSLLRPGEYRLTADNASSTSVAVRAGQAQVQDGEQQRLTLSTGQRGLFGAGGSYAITPPKSPDEFDLWCQQRQSRWAQERAAAQPYVSSDAVGYEDLGDYGQWQAEPDYGYVWFPTQVPAYWVPYSTGHWVWIRPWGWSWVDEAPWGFAPFHYGRWCHIGRRWGWVPAPPHARAVYAPALVAWIGGPGTAGAAVLGGGAAVGWLPLAPGEVFIPAYRSSPRYLRDVNLSNSRHLNAGTIAQVGANPSQQYRYINRDVAGAVTAVPQVNFTAGQSAARHRIDPPAPWQNAAPMARAPAITPEQQSVLGTLTLGHVATPPATVRGPSQPRLAAAQPSAVPMPSAAPPLPRAAPQPPGLGPNVFERRDREIEQERQARLHEQPMRPQQTFESSPPPLPQPHFEPPAHFQSPGQQRPPAPPPSAVPFPPSSVPAPPSSAPPLPQSQVSSSRGSPNVRPSRSTDPQR